MSVRLRCRPGGNVGIGACRGRRAARQRVHGPAVRSPRRTTLVARHQPSLTWDLGETHGTVAVRMPSHPVALELLAETGPMAVSSANLTGHPSPQDCDAAQGMLGDSVAVYLDGGPTEAAVASSIVDLTGPVPVLKRAGAISAEILRKVVPDLKEP
ncbi:Sua5/YciO/YrdC/YwlC family protein [Streptomyces sp. MS1.HAVA.3]|uniref:L-threonylcarbamoyladenylate synthase n=1 Tax=Streptomyces caledonius TaxID=3134107 RepID=A0ABU8U2Q2_9ACTN